MADAISNDAIDRFASLFKNTHSIKVGGFTNACDEVKLSVLRLLAKIIMSSLPKKMNFFMIYDLSRSIDVLDAAPRDEEKELLDALTCLPDNIE